MDEGASFIGSPSRVRTATAIRGLRGSLVGDLGLCRALPLRLRGPGSVDARLAHGFALCLAARLVPALRPGQWHAEVRRCRGNPNRLRPCLRASQSARRRSAGIVRAMVSEPSGGHKRGVISRGQTIIPLPPVLPRPPPSDIFLADHSEPRSSGPEAGAVR